VFCRAFCCFITYMKSANAFCMWKGMAVNLRMNHCCQLQWALLLLPPPPPPCFTLSVHVHLFKTFRPDHNNAVIGSTQYGPSCKTNTTNVQSHSTSVPSVFVSRTVPVFVSHRGSNKAGAVNRHSTDFCQVRRSFE
jgi:hypothetical protein